MAIERPTAYSPRFEHDLFISYAQVDDQPDIGPVGRVSKLVELLTKRLATLLGRPDSFSIWMDRTRLDATFQVTPGIEKTLGNTAVMLALLSNGYLASRWCSWEREVFLRGLPPVPVGPARVFVIELDRLEDALRPKEFTDYLWHKFWVQGPLDKNPRLLSAFDPASATDFLSHVDDLAREVVKVLKQVKEHGGGAPPPRPPQTVVYLAEATDDLDPAREKVKRYLEQQEIAVVPRQYLPRDPDACRQAVDSSLADADLFVQLLSKVAGRRLDGGPTYTEFQYRCATEAGLPVLQWRDPLVTEQELEGIEDPVHRGLLEGPEVQAVQFEEFKQEVLKTLKRLRDQQQREKELEEKVQEASVGKNNDRFVFLVADPKDETIARSLFEFLDQQGFPCALPIALEDRDSTPAKIREDFEGWVSQADGTVIVYGQTPAAWYRSQLGEVRKLLAQDTRDKRNRVLGLFVGPPPKQVFFKLPGMHLIKCDEGIEVKAIQPFLESLLGSVAQKQKV